MCGSMNPGTTVSCKALMCSASSGSRTSERRPTDSILPLRTMMRPGANLSTGLRTEPASTTRTRLFTPGTQMSQDFSQVAAAFVEALLCFLSTASQSAHDDGELKLASAGVRKFLCLFGSNSKNLPQYLNAAFMQLGVRHVDVDHPVAVRHAETNHGRCADHVQHQLL